MVVVAQQVRRRQVSAGPIPSERTSGGISQAKVIGAGSECAAAGKRIGAFLSQCLV
jgi:hypothetical protein